ncbi:MAG TPA: hypothetical protein VF730_06780, partial [Terracidiphilus sp.]
VVLADGFVGQMMEPVEFPRSAILPRQPDWAVTGSARTRANLISSLHLDADEMEAHQHRLEAKYREAEKREARAEEWLTDDAEIILTGYGIVGRILKAVTAEARAGGLKVGLLRPITLYPFPAAYYRRLALRAHLFFVVEMSNGQMLDDVRLSLNGTRPVEFFSRVGGNVPSHQEVLALVRKFGRQMAPFASGEERKAYAY